MVFSHHRSNAIELGRLARLALMAITVLLPTSQVCAGAFIFAGESNGVSVVTHPTPYTGTGGVVNVNICIDPASANAAEMQTSVQNIINTYNQLQATTGNLKLGSNNNVPSNYFDFESVALHEVGHCIGMAHPNASSESGLTGNNTNYTQATVGANNVFDINAGPDGIIGSSDDIRGDDVNLHWFRKYVNNPFTIDTIVDSSTYTIDLAYLPAGDTFAANADRSVGALLGYPNTEAVMQQGTAYDEAQRTLSPDDVATLRYGMSGVDETHGSADDYTINLVYKGITTSNCHITLKIGAISGLAYCQTGGASITSRHFHITSANVYLSDAYYWFFNDVSNQHDDTTPDAFTFLDQNNVVLNSTVTSGAITVSGINAAAGISVAGGQYSINQGAFTSTSATVNNGDQVRVRHTSSPNYSTSVNTILTIGGVGDTFTSTTLGADTTPNSFTFTDQLSVNRNALIISSPITVTGINSAASISVVGGEYSIDGAAFTSAGGSVDNNQSVRVRHTSAANFSTATNTVLSIGGVSDTFTSITESIDTTPNAFSFTAQVNVPLNTVITSNSITVSGINSAASISVNGGEYSINSAPFTAVAGQVNTGDSVRVRHTSSSNVSTKVSTTLTIGGVSAIFSSTTGLVDTTPNGFTFTDQTNAPLSTIVISNSITVTGIDAPAPVSVVGGEYSINGGAFTTIAGNVNNNDTVRVRHTSSANYSAVTNTVLTIGGISDTFSSTTTAAPTGNGGGKGNTSTGGGGGAFGLPLLLSMLGALALRMRRRKRLPPL